ncbi:hypothetical protein [Thalassobaculum sp.]|jgi:hypothetical protein
MTKLTPTEARQGRWGSPVLVVLAVSVTIAVVALGAVAIFSA